MKAVIYARYSSDNQREESIDGQLRECMEFAKYNEMTVVNTYIDRALSAKTDNRPEFQRMIKDSYKCNCPHADGKRIVCKHMMAVYFTAFPEEAQRIYNEAMAYQEQEDKRAEELYEKVRQHVWKMKKNEAQQALLELLFDGPEWQFDRFVRERDLEDDYY